MPCRGVYALLYRGITLLLRSDGTSPELRRVLGILAAEGGSERECKRERKRETVFLPISSGRYDTPIQWLPSINRLSLGIIYKPTFCWMSSTHSFNEHRLNI